MSELNRMTVTEFRESEKVPVVLVLDNIRSQSNIGSIFRTADAFRLQKLFLCGITATPPHREIHKTALGATESIDWAYVPTTAEAVRELAEQGYTILAVEQAEGSISLGDYRPEKQEKYALIFGNEVNGIDDAVLGLVHACIEIPQFGTKHSLNVAVAAGIMIWDLLGKLKNLQEG